MPHPAPHASWLGACLAALLALPAAAQDMPVRDCRADAAPVLPLVPAGHDALVAHATDDLLGPSIFDRVARTEDGAEIALTTRGFDSYAAQLPAYLACDMPFMRVTHAQMTLLADQTGAQDQTRMVPVFFYGWSNGADAVVARGQTGVQALSGAAIATDAVRLDLALQLAQDVAETPEIRLVDDPAASFAEDAALPFTVVPAPVAERLTAGSVGTGAEGSVAEARQVLTTTSANRVIGDLLVVRQDYLDANPEIVRGTVRALLKAEELFREDAKKQVVDFARSAEMVLGDASREDEMMRLWRGVETVGLAGQVDWATPTAPRSYRAVVNAGQTAMVETGLIAAAVPLADPPLDYASLGDDIWDKRRVQTDSFDQDAASAAIRAMSNDEIAENTIAAVTILFEPNQASFPVDDYRDAFEEALNKSRVYAGAVLSIEAHSSYLGYLKGVIQQDWPVARQKRELASLRNTSTARALAVRDALVATADELGLAVDDSQITINGRGIEDPLGGFCDNLPCPPKTEQEWRESRRVLFRVIGMESEAEVFTPLNEW
ncbi:hypothetical protein [Pseudoponticoccus marisrubri]|uniref:OmpA-like domain-containing protein n=1 Tax=Pseudoponticoccus marisrubri TaxID=1685382 RepID=A0A0W7WE04_9RHOB|nr:hypothetical protein [Pseudoponticoccus marisrubri]KUF08761.1 hypothetical protein AVJ23_21180 [Pseudoponticoccus marisrubri]